MTLFKSLKVTILSIGFIVIFSSCKNYSTKKAGSSNSSTNTLTHSDTTTQVALKKSWMDDFRDFRMAVYNNDMPKLKTYFSFPIKDEDGQLWGLCRPGMAQQDSGTTLQQHGRLFDEKDLERYHGIIFPPSFIKSILKIKSAELCATGKAETKQFVDEDRPYKMYATFNKEAQTLELNMAYYNGDDGNGAYVSEGEYNYIYTFRIIGNEHLLFEKIEMAG